MSIFPNFFLSLSTKLQNGLKVTPESSIVAGSQKKKYIFLSPGILKRFRPEVVKKAKTLREMGELAFFCRFVVLLTFGNITD